MAAAAPSGRPALSTRTRLVRCAIQRPRSPGSKASSASRSSRPSRGTPVRRNRHRHAVAADDAAEVCRRVFGIVHRVHEDAARLGGRQHLLVDLARRRRHDPPRTIEVRVLNARRTTVTPACTISGRTSGATTVTSAPAASSASSLLAATGPPPTTTTRREQRCRNAGNIGIKTKSPGVSSRAFRSLACSWVSLFATHAADRKRRDPTGPHTTTRARPAARGEHDVRHLNARP